MKTLCYNIAGLYRKVRIFIRHNTKKKKQFMDDIIQNPVISDDIQAMVDELIEKESGIPYICPDCTALFATLEPDKSKINYLNEIYYRRKIRITSKVLFGRGYTTFIVNSGTQYGMLAMEELLAMRKAGCAFRIYCGKSIGDRHSLLDNTLMEIFMSSSCDKSFYAYHPMEYVKYVIQRVSIICDESGVLLTYQQVPSRCMEYYKRFLENKKKLDVI